MMAQLEVLKRRQRTDDEVNWVTAFFMFAFHIGAVVALFFFTWKAFFVAAFLWWVATSVGIGMGYHRLLTHRGFKVPLWLEYVMTVCATLALEGGPIFWVATHRIHHQHRVRPHTEVHQLRTSTRSERGGGPQRETKEGEKVAHEVSPGWFLRENDVYIAPVFRG